ncbi:MAG: nicotinamide mononucleotide transporter [Gemmatimonadales bacterium]|nr:nicotinamide mononucleotide transporter [Gemmatimonadales bacterium]
MSLFEITAALFGIVSVYLSTRQNVWSWPTSLVNNVMYIVYFLGLKLYALMALNGLFALIAVYGWYEWKFGGKAKTELKVSRTPLPLAGALAAISVVGTVLLWWVLKRTQDPAPLIDGMFFSVSLLAQWMMARKYYECWWVWVALNCIAVPFFFLQGSYPTMVQYAVFLVLATQGWRFWKKSLPGAA